MVDRRGLLERGSHMNRPLKQRFTEENVALSVAHQSNSKSYKSSTPSLPAPLNLAPFSSHWRRKGRNDFGCARGYGIETSAMISAEAPVAQVDRAWDF